MVKIDGQTNNEQMVTYDNGNCKGKGTSKVITDDCSGVSCQCGKPEYCDYAHFTVFEGDDEDNPKCHGGVVWAEMAFVMDECLDYSPKYRDDRMVTFSECNEDKKTFKRTISATCDTGGLIPPEIKACEVGM